MRPIVLVVPGHLGERTGGYLYDRRIVAGLRGLGWAVERIMNVPLVSVAQVRMLSEGLAESCPPFPSLPMDLAPKIPFSEDQIRKGLPAAGAFGWKDLRCCANQNGARPRRKSHVFFEMP
jgi:hypothetical protein